MGEVDRIRNTRSRAMQEQLPSAYLLRLNGTHSVPYLKPEFGIRNNKPRLSFIKVNLLPQASWLIFELGLSRIESYRLVFPTTFASRRES
jgi:hypothetical protein